MLTIHHETECPTGDYSVGNVGRVGFAGWFGVTSPDAVRAIAPAMEAASGQGRSIGLVAIIGPHAVVPSPAILMGVNRALRDPRFNIRAMAVWLDGGSFIAAKHL